MYLFQSANQWRWCSRDGSGGSTARDGTESERRGTVLLAGVRRSARGLSNQCRTLCVIFRFLLQVVPYTLAENAGLSPITTVTELRNQHAAGNKDYGINVRKVCAPVIYMGLGFPHLLAEEYSYFAGVASYSEVFYSVGGKIS
jgi:hypothetical protein